jgi:hypothetical protein
VRLFFVAQQRGLAMHCEGYAVEEERFTLVMEDSLSEIAELTEPDQDNLPLDMVRGSYAMVMGGQIAAAAYDRETIARGGRTSGSDWPATPRASRRCSPPPTDRPPRRPS